MAILPEEVVEEEVEVEDMIVVMEEDPILVVGEGRMVAEEEVDMVVAEEEAIDVRTEMDIRPRRTVAGRIVEEVVVVDMAVIVVVRKVVISFRFSSYRFPASTTHYSILLYFHSNTRRWWVWRWRLRWPWWS